MRPAIDVGNMEDIKMIELRGEKTLLAKEFGA
jgi:hypothetical protein